MKKWLWNHHRSRWLLSLLTLALALGVSLPDGRGQTTATNTTTATATSTATNSGTSLATTNVPLRTSRSARTNEAKNASASRSSSSSGAVPADLETVVSTMNLERTPEALFEAVQSQRSGGKLSDGERFRLAVLLGDWPYVGTALKSLPPEEAMKAYSRLLESLATNSLSAAQFFRASSSRSSSSSSSPSSGSGPGSGSSARGPDKRGLLLSEDFYAIIEAAPADLTAAHLEHVATLIKVAIGPGGKKEFLPRLAKGLKGIGGETASSRKLAAQLLSEAGWMSDSGPYLPLVREEWGDADTLTLVLTMEYFTQTGVEQRDERQLKRAAEVCAYMMQTSRFSANERGIFRQATERFVKLLPALEAEDAEQLIRENFLTQPVIMVDLILTLGDAGQRAAAGTDLKLRTQSLATQNVLLRVLQNKKSALPEAVNVLVMNWLNEAEQAYRRGGARDAGSDVDSDGVYVYRTVANARASSRTLTPEVLLEHAPAKAIIRRLNQGLAQRVNLTLLKVNLIEPKEPLTLEALRGYLKDHPGQEKELCQDYLGAWVRKRTVVPEDPNITRLRAMGYSVAKPQASGIPLTRLRQNQNVQDLKSLVAALRELSPEPIDANVVVQSFMSIHSGAEVYRLEDIEGIFGPPDKIDRAELMNLITGMRTKLREQWRDLTQQQEAGTNRTEQEAKDEVSRGYRTALELARRGLRPDNAEWKEFIVRGQLFFDTAEYEFTRQIKLVDYVDLREEAFGSYRKAAELYAAKVPQLPRGQWTTEPYQMWFYVMLGASDLSQLTRAAARSDPGLKQIGDAMRVLPGEAAEVHLEQFGEMLGQVLTQVPANMKQRFLSAGLQVVGEEHPSAKTAANALNSYKELLDEVQLRLTVDGPTRVGYHQPFGAFLTLEHSRQLARESGGFAKYLQNQATQSRSYMYVYSGSQKPTNHRDEFSKGIHTALDETFDVLSITFHDANVKPIDLPREGWQETPLAYLVLRAHDAAVDRIPSLQLDMDFSDQGGQVILPIRSQVQPIDAKDAAPPLRPSEELTLSFTMDEREWRDGKVVVEVAAKARGVIPAHTQLFAYERPGFDTEVTDSGLSVAQFVSDGRKKTANADRSWQLTYRRKKDLRGDVLFQFPTLQPGINASTVEYKHYQDADLVALNSKQALAGVTLSSRTSRGLRHAAVLLVASVLAVVLALFLRRRQNRENPVAMDMLLLPSQITPFSVVAFLQRLEREHGSRLDPPGRQALQTQIRELEGAFFSGAAAGNGNGNGAVDLEATARNWHQRVQRL